ncbi:hypothetical protein LTR03_016819 [Friedmanniomyces endolithicus]|nr:hypothetical protein LTR03_016819 [Friedmanniomyces endolithicus]
MAAITLPAKRKRAQVSYLDDGDEELEEMLGVDVATVPAVDDDSDVDMSFGSHKLYRSSTSTPLPINTLTVPQNPHAIKRRKVAKKVKAPAKPKKNQKPFPFTLLPPELRDYIYELALTDEAGVTLISKTKNYRRTVAPGSIVDRDNGGYYGGRRRIRRLAFRQSQSQSQSQGSQGEPTRAILSPALLAVSKQIHAEGINFLYQNRIIVEDTYALHGFLATIGSNRSRVTDLTVRGWGNSRGAHKAMNFCSFTLLAGCTNLKKLYLDCALGWRRDIRGLARQLYRDGVYFFEAYGLANGSKSAGVEIVELNETNFDIHKGYQGRDTSSPEKDEFKEKCQAELKRLLGCR